MQEPFWEVGQYPEQPGVSAVSLVSRFAGCVQQTMVLLKLSTCSQELPPGLVSIQIEAAPEAGATAAKWQPLRERLRRHAWSCTQLQRIDACRRPPDLHPDANADVAVTAAEAGARVAAEPADNTLPATASPAEAAPQTLIEAAAGLLTMLAAAVAERCLIADEPVSDRRAAELQAACDPGSPLWPKFRDGANAEPASTSTHCDAGKQCSRSGCAAEARSNGMHQVSAAVHGCETSCGQSGWTANMQRQQAVSAAATACRIIAPAPVLVLFSGGVDSTLLAALAHQVHSLAKARCIVNSCQLYHCVADSV